jgi:C-terminal processing protease CtpA/Prc
MPVKGLGIDQVLAKLRGTAGTEVRLRVARAGQADPIDFKLVREVIRPRGAEIEVRAANGELAITATGPWSVLEFEKGKPVLVKAVSDTEFRDEDGEHTRIAFIKDPAGKVSSLVLNPGAWEIRAVKIK